MKLETLLVELLTEELPPISLNELGEKFAQLILEGLQKKISLEDNGMKFFATPRRLGVKILNVPEKSSNQKKLIKLMPAKIGFDEQKNATQALIKKLHSLNETDEAVSRITNKNEKNQEILYLEKNIPGINLEDILSEIINNSINRSPTIF